MGTSLERHRNSSRWTRWTRLWSLSCGLSPRTLAGEGPSAQGPALRVAHSGAAGRGLETERERTWRLQRWCDQCKPSPRWNSERRKIHLQERVDKIY